jgi:acetyl-CoA carboxylase/biotin carboxylase 1
MAAFESFSQFEQYADEMLDLLEDLSSPAVVSPKVLEAVESGSESRLSTSINISMSVADGRANTDELQKVLDSAVLKLKMRLKSISKGWS